MVFLAVESNLAVPNIGIPDASRNSFVCIAAWKILQRNIKLNPGNEAVPIID
jgi:hypothetical protein